MSVKTNFNSQRNELSYNNELNKLIFRNFNSIDYDIFFTICYFASKYRKKTAITLSFDILKEFLPKERNKKRFYENVVNFALKLNNLKASLYSVDAEGFRNFSVSSFFEKIKVNEKKEEINFEIHKDSLDLLFELSSYTKIDMQDFCNISNKYAKITYRFLKQWESTGQFHISFDDFVNYFDIPNTYNKRKIESRVIEPSIEILSGKSENTTLKKHFNNLNYKTITKGRVVKEIIFTFDVPENRVRKSKALSVTPPPPTKREIVIFQ